MLPQKTGWRHDEIYTLRMLPRPFWEILGKPIDSLAFLTHVSTPISDVIDFDNKNQSVGERSVYKWVHFLILVPYLFLNRFEFKFLACDRVNLNFTMSDQRYYTLAEGELCVQFYGWQLANCIKDVPSQAAALLSSCVVSRAVVLVFSRILSLSRPWLISPVKESQSGM